MRRGWHQRMISLLECSRAPSRSAARLPGACVKATSPLAASWQATTLHKCTTQPPVGARATRWTRWTGKVVCNMGKDLQVPRASLTILSSDLWARASHRTTYWSEVRRMAVMVATVQAFQSLCTATWTPSGLLLMLMASEMDNQRQSADAKGRTRARPPKMEKCSCEMDWKVMMKESHAKFMYEIVQGSAARPSTPDMLIAAT